jgi:hypothetical protein
MVCRKALLTKKMSRFMKKVKGGYLIIIIYFIISINFTFAASFLERVDIINPRLENSSGSKISEHVNINQQVQISADIKNNQEKGQKFVYAVQIKNQYDVIVKLDWITGSLDPGQTFSPSLSWMPQTSDFYKVEIYVWESFLNPDALTNESILNITS